MADGSGRDGSGEYGGGEMMCGDESGSSTGGNNALEKISRHGIWCTPYTGCGTRWVF